MATNILGLSAYYHDSAAALVRDGRILAAAQEERFTRAKHDSAFPEHAVRFCLEDNGLAVNDLDYVAFYEKPFIRFDRILETYLAYAPLGIRSFFRSMPMWLNKKLWIKDLMEETLGYKGDIIFLEHHQSHAASAFLPSPFQEAAFLTLDGVGEWTTASFGVGKGNSIEIMSELKFPHSLGLLYSAFTYYLGFAVNSGEYKVMGLAPYGLPEYADIIRSQLMDLKEDGSFRLNMKYFDYCTGLTMTNSKFNDLFGGPPRRRGSSITQKDKNIARSIQSVTEEIMLRMARHVHDRTGQKNLCLAGGVALNCVGNGRVLREGPFERIWIQPAASDAGGALGAALFAWYGYLDKERETAGRAGFHRSYYLGPEHAGKEPGASLDEAGAPYRVLSWEEIPEVVADLLVDQKVVGWFQGRMEFGPRALGARSILGDAWSPEMKDRINLKIKHRESFRPFAPSVMKDKASDVFDLDADSPYMSLVAPVKERFRGEIPAVTHVDFSARVQTVSEEDNALYYRLISAFYEKTGCPAILNTSFNVRGEPIVCTPEEAYLCFMRTGMDYLVMGRCLLDKREQRGLKADDNWREAFDSPQLQ